jgi:ABC-2 type transport system ATP-binding protein
MLVRIENLQKIYSGITVLDIPALEIKPGELVGIVGNNGAGKTTLLRLILDLIEPGTGHVEIGSVKVHQNDSWKKHTGSFLDEGFLIGFLTPEEYFRFNAETYGISSSDALNRLREYDVFMSGELLGTNKYIRQLSTGNKQKTGIIAAMMVNPPLLLLDEPFNFLDPSSQINIRNLLRDKNRSLGNTMLISSHNINHLTGICTRIILLEKGRIIKDISVQDSSRINEIEDYFAGATEMQS